MIADTTFLIDILKNHQPAISKAKELEAKDENIATTTVTVFEIVKGNDAADRKKLDKILELLHALRILPFEFDSAFEAGKIHRELMKKGVTIDPEDSMIAGITRLNVPV